MASQEENSSIPAGWFLANDKLNGKTVKCYTNVLGQKYYSMEDLMRYVNYAQKAKVSIYAPGFSSSTMEDFSSVATGSRANSSTHKKGINMKSKKNPPIAAKQKKQADHTSARKSSLDPAHASNKSEKSSNLTEPTGRTSRRLAQLEPEYLPDLSTIHAQEVAGKLWASKRSTELVADNFPDSEVTKYQKEVTTIEPAEMPNAPDAGASSSE